MKRVLFTATIDDHIICFHLPYLKWFKEQGFEVHVASKGNSDISFVDFKHNIPFERSPLKRSNFKAYKQLKQLIDENSFEVIHCHTPMGSVLTRLAAKKVRNQGTKVIYTAHGFHFFKGAPKINWLLYYTIEKMLSKYTDCLITINEEDYRAALVNKFKMKKIYKIAGVGINLKRFRPGELHEKELLREQLGFTQSDFILIYVAEMNENKNHRFLLEVVPVLKSLIPDLKIMFIGEGSERENLRKIVLNQSIEENVLFIGYRKDVDQWYRIADLAISTSLREGLPVNILEAMASGLPAVVTNCRGNRDLIISSKNGFVVNVDDKKELVKAIDEIYKSPDLRENYKNENLELIQKYSLESIMEEMQKVYLDILDTAHKCK